jgi:POT family proton-dependent oligopeptide transporter
MSKTKYLTAPLPIETMPPGVPYIIGNEAAERFCFYGMQSILVVYMTQFLLNRQGHLALMGDEEAKGFYALFVAGVYFFPLFGAIIADAFLGKFRTIFYLSLLYCVGNFVMAANQTRMGLFLGLLLIALGAGGIKSSVSSNVGDQFGLRNSHLLAKVYGWFYFSVNFGSFFSTLLTPFLLYHFSDVARYGQQAKHLGPAVAFGVPGVLMLTSTLIFWLGRKKFVHVPPSGSALVKEAFSPEGLKVIGKLWIMFLFNAAFNSLYYQCGAAWVLQAIRMDRHLLAWFQPAEQWLVGSGVTFVRGLSKLEIEAPQVGACNPLLIMMFIPLFSYAIYPMLGKFVRLKPLRKIGTGFFLTVVAFAIAGHAETLILRSPASPPSVWWQLLAFTVITVAELMINITLLEFYYTQAPKGMKALVMGMSGLSVTIGNLFTACVNFFIMNPDGTSKLPGASYYWFFAGLMFLASLLFCVYAALYREKTNIQDDAGKSA